MPIAEWGNGSSKLTPLASLPHLNHKVKEEKDDMTTEMNMHMKEDDAFDPSPTLGDDMLLFDVDGGLPDPNEPEWGLDPWLKADVDATAASSPLSVGSANDSISTEVDTAPIDDDKHHGDDRHHTAVVTADHHAAGTGTGTQHKTEERAMLFEFLH